MTKKKTKTKPAKKLDNKETPIVFVLDRSGSMNANKVETISGFNTYLKKLKDGKASGRSRFTMVQFDSEGIDTLYDETPIKEVKPLTEATFVPRSWTPLYDAVGRTINRMSSLKDVQFAILTDGQENASKEFTLDAVQKLMKECEKNKGWMFNFIAMSPEGWAAADRMAFGTQSVGNVMKISRDPKQVKSVLRRAGGQSAMYATAMASGDVGLVSKMKANFWNKKNTKDNE